MYSGGICRSRRPEKAPAAYSLVDSRVPVSSAPALINIPSLGSKRDLDGASFVPPIVPDLKGNEKLVGNAANTDRLRINLPSRWFRFSLQR